MCSEKKAKVTLHVHTCTPIHALQLTMTETLSMHATGKTKSADCLEGLGGVFFFLISITILMMFVRL